MLNRWNLAILLLAGAPLRAESLACAPSTPVVLGAGTVNLNAWSDAPPSKPVTWRWTVEHGSVQPGKAGAAVWNLGGADDGPFTATVELSAAGSVIATCAVEVRVVHVFDSKTRGEGHSAFHAFLDGAGAEPANLGQYSYLLLGAKPKDADKERYKNIVAALLRQIPAEAELMKYVEPARLNGTFLPVLDAPPPNADAAWILDHYDYSRATALLSRVPDAKPTGIYLVSASKPLLNPQTKGPYLVQDLSAIPAGLVSTWVTTFVNQAAQVRFWEGDAATNLVLRLRLSLSVLAVGVPQVQDAVKKWVATKG